ncbi:MAG: glycoside hydrolase family 108 protein [Limnospira sp.]
MTTSRDSFHTALEFTLKWEGGVGHPEDLGGVVNYGITQATYDTYLENQGKPSKSVKEISKLEVEEVYYTMYWQPCKADLMALPLAVVQFDTAVNFSVRASIEFLQEILGGLTVDGKFGPKTQAALEQKNNLDTAQRYGQARMDYRYKRVEANPDQELFLEGWLRRDRDLLSYATQLGGGTPPPPPSPPEDPGSLTQPEILDKLQQAIALLQEVAASLKNN